MTMPAWRATALLLGCLMPLSTADAGLSTANAGLSTANAGPQHLARSHLSSAPVGVLTEGARASSSRGPIPLGTGTFDVGTAVFQVKLPAGAGTTWPRALTTQVWYPAKPRAGKLVPDWAGAPYPLVVFSQGFDFAVSGYAPLLSHWASAGFVVAAPSYPFTTPPGPLDEADLVNHPAELRSVIARLTGGALPRGAPPPGLVKADDVGIAGQSDGGDVSLAVAENTCCHDPNVKAVVVLSGAELSSFGGNYFSGPMVPILMVQGSADTVNPPACSEQIYNAARKPKWYLDLLGSGHLVPYSAVGTPPHGPVAQKDASYRRVVAAVTTDFLEAELAPSSFVRRVAARSLAGAGNMPGIAQISGGPRVPLANGSCPGAPR